MKNWNYSSNCTYIWNAAEALFARRVNYQYLWLLFSFICCSQIYSVPKWKFFCFNISYSSVFFKVKINLPLCSSGGKIKTIKKMLNSDIAARQYNFVFPRVFEWLKSNVFIDFLYFFVSVCLCVCVFLSFCLFAFLSFLSVFLSLCTRWKYYEKLIFKKAPCTRTKKTKHFFKFFFLSYLFNLSCLSYLFVLLVYWSYFSLRTCTFASKKRNRTCYKKNQHFAFF